MAMRAAANPNDPAAAFAEEFLSLLFEGGGVPSEDVVLTNATPEQRAAYQQLTVDLSDAVKDGDTGAQAYFLNQLTELRLQWDTRLTRAQALAQVARQLGITLDPTRFTLSADGRVVAIPGSGGVDPYLIERIAQSYRRAFPDMPEDEVQRRAYEFAAALGGNTPLTVRITTRSRNDLIIDDLFGAGSSATLDGALSGVLRVGAEQVLGLIELGKLSVEGYLNLINVIAGENLFPGAAQASADASEALRSFGENLDKLPDAIKAHVESELARADALQAQGRTQEAADVRSALAAGMVLMVMQTRGGASARELVEAIEAARVARVAERWAVRESSYVIRDEHGNIVSWIRKPAGASDAAYQLAADLERAGIPKPGDGYEAHHLVGFANLMNQRNGSSVGLASHRTRRPTEYG